MDHSPLSSVKRPRFGQSRSVVWPTVTSVLLVAVFASSPADSELQPDIETSAPTDRATVLASYSLSKLGALPAPKTASRAVVQARRLPPPRIDIASFNERFEGPSDADKLAASLPHIDRAGAGFDDSDAGLPEEAAGSVRAGRERAVLSPIRVFSFDLGTSLPPANPVIEQHADADRPLMQPRPDLLSGVPEEYATLTVALAAEEGVDPNWVLSIMRAENAGFDPRLVSSAGAIGLMQVMPEIGKAFGVQDLTDPEQNIRAGTRVLRILIDKYRNPVLIASAYNAGEPRVDLNRSLPLIRETADYVTRVVGYYTGAPATSQAPVASTSSTPDRPRRTGPVDRAKSPMLVFSVPDPLASDAHLHPTEKAAQVGGPVKIVKEEVLQ
jgi:soluble lytic murein transglycosylase-like protein|nr:lytic transglycosylase domain-containing protein [Rhizobium sp. P007]